MNVYGVNTLCLINTSKQNSINKNMCGGENLQEIFQLLNKNDNLTEYREYEFLKWCSIQNLIQEYENLKNNQFKLEQINKKLVNNQTCFSTVTDQLVKQNARLLEENNFLNEQLKVIMSNNAQEDSKQI